MNKHRQTKINGKNAIVSLVERAGKHQIDVLMCSDEWTPVSDERGFSALKREDVVAEISQKYGVSIDRN